MQIYLDGFEARRFQLKELATGNLQTLARFRDKIKAQQIYVTGLKYENPEMNIKKIDDKYVDELVSGIISVLKDFYAKHKEVVENIIIEVGENTSFLALPSNSYTDGSTVVLGILAPEVVAHELGHVVDFAENPGKMGAAMLSRLGSFATHMIGPSVAGLAARKGKTKTAIAVPIVQANANLLAAYLISKREDAATRIATETSSYIQDNIHAQEALKEARSTYDISNALRRELLPGLMGTGAAVSTGLALRSLAKSKQKKTLFGKKEPALSMTPEQLMKESFLVGPAGTLGYGLGLSLFNKNLGPSSSGVFKTTTDPLHKNRKKSCSLNIFDIMKIKTPRRLGI